jgi:hypothetical protein
MGHGFAPSEALHRATMMMWLAVGTIVLPCALVFLFVEPEPTMAIPVMIVLAPLPARRQPMGWVIAGLSAAGLFAFAVLGMMSVGWMFFPGAMSMAATTALLRWSRS